MQDDVTETVDEIVAFFVQWYKDSHRVRLSPVDEAALRIQIQEILAHFAEKVRS